MGPAISVPRPTTVCDASTAFSIQYSGSGNASWDGQWVGLVDSPSGQVGAGIRPVSRAKAATFFRDPNQLLYSADLATMDYASVTESPSNCLLFAPSNVELPEYWGTTPLNISSKNTITNIYEYFLPRPDFVVVRDHDCVALARFHVPWDVFPPETYTPVTLNVVKTGTCPGKICKPLPAGLGPVPSPDTVDEFLKTSDFETAAKNAITPTRYQNTFTNAKAANNANGYLGYTTLPTYDVDACSKKCDSIVGCQAFNIYFERDPKVEPGSGDYCNNPSSTTTIKCSFWGGPVTKENAVNSGQWRKNFQIVIAGSNGYVNNAIAPIPNYKSAAYYGNSMIVPPPTDCSSINPTLAWQLYNDGAPFAASRCAAACDAFSANAKLTAAADGNTKPVLCNYFNTFIINKGNKALGQMCYLYSQAFKSSRATAKTQVDDAGNIYSVSFSYGFASSSAVGTCGANY